MKNLTSSQIQAIDLQHTWHPYSSLTKPLPCYHAISASGVRIKLADGNELIDGTASWWSTIHGYNNLTLNEAATAQLQNMSHVMFGGICHEPAARLVQSLVDITPDGLQKVFLSDSGSVSVEVALKMAIQYWYSKGQANKHRILTVRKGYHGDTFGAMAVCDPETGMHHLFQDSMPKQIFADAPACEFSGEWSDEYIRDFTEKIQAHHHELAAVILEPIVQGAGGMRFYAPEYLRQVRALCDQHNVLLIADEIATGFGRTGKLFACEWADITPDILCLGKAITGGYMSLAATLCTDEIAEGICNGEAGVFMHGPTFMGNPLACSVANASIELLLNSDWQNNIKRIESELKNGLSPCIDYHTVADVRVLGAIGVVEMRQAVDVAALQKQFVNAGVWIRPFGKNIYVMPPYIIDNLDLEIITTAICEAAKNS